MNPSNIYIIIIVFAILFLLLDFTITNIHFKLETFSNPVSLSSSNSSIINEGIINEGIINAPSSSVVNTPIINTTIIDELNNTELKIDNFYPKISKKLSVEELKKITFENKLFHQILPKFGDGYLGIIWHESQIAGIYTSESLLNNNWNLMENSMPDNMSRPVFMSFDKDRKLMVIYEEEESGNYNVNKYHLYKKEEVDLTSSFKFIEKSKISNFIFDKDEIMVGLDDNGNWYKKKSNDIQSDWGEIELGFTNIPMRRLLFDFRTKYMIGLGQDFRIYKKRTSDWLNEEWDTINGPSKKTLGGTVKDIWYDYDGILMGLSRIGLVKQKNTYYLSGFKAYNNEVTKKEVSIYKVLYGSTGISVFANLSLNNNSNNVYVEGKKISEYKFKDPRLNKYLKHRMGMKKKCRKLKAMKISQDESNTEVEEDVRNDRFMRILDEQKDTIDNLIDSISYLRNK